MQVLIETLLRCQLATVGEVVVELVALEHFVRVLVFGVRILPLNVEEVTAVAGVLHPATGECRSFEPLILGAER